MYKKLTTGMAGVVILACIFGSLWFVSDLSSGTGVDEQTMGHWHLNEGSGNKTEDISGNGNNGTICGAQWILNDSEMGLRFDGIDDYVEIPDSDTLDITDKLTLEAWIKLMGDTDDGIQRIIHKSYQKNYELWTSNAGGLAFRISNHSKFDVLGCAADLKDGKWHYIAGVYNGESIKLYIDGNLTASKTTVVSALGVTTDPVIIGNVGNGTDWPSLIHNKPFNGSIAEVRISNTNRTEQEISEEASRSRQTYINQTYVNNTYINNTYENTTYENNTYENHTHYNVTYENHTHENITYENNTYLNENITYLNETYNADYPTYTNKTYLNITYLNITYENQSHNYPPNDNGSADSVIQKETDGEMSAKDYVLILLMVVIIMIQIVILFKRREQPKSINETRTETPLIPEIEKTTPRPIITDLKPIVVSATKQLPPRTSSQR